MGYSKLQTKAWKDPLGPQYLNTLRGNLSYLQQVASAEHIISTGEHNAKEIPRVVRKISGTTVTPASSDITGVTNPSAGKYVLTLAGGRFTAPDIRVQLNICDGALAPSLGKATYVVVNSTTVEVYTWLMSSSFYNPSIGGSGGNTWTAVNLDFDVAIHSTQLSAGSWSLPAPWARGANGGGLVGNGAPPTPSWSSMVTLQGDLQRVLLSAHDSAGEHIVREVAKVSGLLHYNGASWSTTSPTISAISVIANGIQLTHASMASQHHGFIAPVVGECYAVQASATTTNVYGFRYQALGWQHDNVDFFIAIHGA